MRYSVSDTAEYGDYTAGPRIVTDETRAEMEQLLAEIQRRLLRRAAGSPRTRRGGRTSRPRRKAEREHPIETVGAELRGMMPFLDAVAVTPEGDVVKTSRHGAGPTEGSR